VSRWPNTGRQNTFVLVVLVVLVELGVLDYRLLDPSKARHKVAFCTPFSARWFPFLNSSAA